MSKLLNTFTKLKILNNRNINNLNLIKPLRNITNNKILYEGGFKPRINKKQSNFDLTYLKPLFNNNDGYKRFNSRPTPNNNQKTQYYFAAFIIISSISYYIIHLERVPISNRLRFINVSPKEELILAEQAYKEIIKVYGNRIVRRNTDVTRMVNKVAKRIIEVAGLSDLDWEVNVIDSDEPNAFVLPGGKIFVFTGILPITKNEDGLAVVIGHEVAHQLTRHIAEKNSFTKLVLYVMLLTSLVMDTSFIFNQYVMQFGIMLPFSRKCEIEADEIGLLLTAQACYNPKEALLLWNRMAKLDSKFDKNVSFLSTHPSSTSRALNLEKKMKLAMDKFQSSDCVSEYGPIVQAFNDQSRIRW